VWNIPCICYFKRQNSSKYHSVLDCFIANRSKSKLALKKYISFLQKLITTPSLSREEDETASLIGAFFQAENIPTNRLGNNIWSRNK